MTAEFGTPAPLPGQPGFRARPSDSMAREAAEMEERLARLKTDLAAEAEMREAAGPRKGGGRWRSARTDRGSVRAYAKDVKTRHKQQLQQRPPHGIFAPGGKVQPQAGAGARAAAALRDEQHQRQQQEHLRLPEQDETSKGESLAASKRSPQASADQCAPAARSSFASKKVSTWGVGDTLDWLDSLGLGKHKGIFQQNEISGPILLEVGLDDLDYMSVRVLAHRKLILKGIEDLRRRGGKSLNADKPPPPAPTPILMSRRGSGSDTNGGEGRLKEETTSAVTTPAPRGREDPQGGDDPSPPGRRKQHWSAIKPLAEHQTEHGYGSPPPAVSLADGKYDEDAARSDFAYAVAEWRGTGKSSATTTTTAPKAVTSETKGRESSLHRPAVLCRAPLAGMLDGGKEGRESSGLLENNTTIGKGLFGGRGGGTDGGAGECWTNPFASPREGGMVAAPTGQSPLRVQRKRQIRTGEQNDFPTLDEEAEHEAFRRAVADWNRRGDANPTAILDSCDGRVVDQNGSCSSPETSTVKVALPSRRTVEAMAEELREQMDAEHRLQAKDLEAKKKALLTSFESARDESREFRGKCSERKLEQDSIGKGGQEVPEADDAVCRDEWGDPSVVSSSTSSLASFPACRSNLEGKDSEGDRDSQSTGHGGGGGVEIEIMESVLGTQPSNEGGMSYLVDQDGSSDEVDL